MSVLRRRGRFLGLRNVVYGVVVVDRVLVGAGGYGAIGMKGQLGVVLAKGAVGVNGLGVVGLEGQRSIGMEGVAVVRVERQKLLDHLMLLQYQALELIDVC